MAQEPLRMIFEAIRRELSQTKHVLIVKLVDNEVPKCCTNNRVAISIRSLIDFQYPECRTEPEQTDKEEIQEGQDIDTCFNYQSDIKGCAREQFQPFKEFCPQEKHRKDGNNSLAQSVMRLNRSIVDEHQIYSRAEL